LCAAKFGQNLLLLRLRHLEEVERSPKFSRDFVGLGGRDLQFAKRIGPSGPLANARHTRSALGRTNDASHRLGGGGVQRFADSFAELLSANTDQRRELVPGVIRAMPRRSHSLDRITSFDVIGALERND
jgi:hypothetical protein